MPPSLALYQGQYKSQRSTVSTSTNASSLCSTASVPFGRGGVKMHPVSEYVERSDLEMVLGSSKSQYGHFWEISETGAGGLFFLRKMPFPNLNPGGTQK
eukprot:1514138-Rhodomonas_salina.2